MATATKTNSKAATGTGASRRFETKIDLPMETRTQMVELLNQQLADTFDLYSQVKQAHWNVKGRDFYQLHKLFDAVAEEVLEWVDMFAERATALGGYATGTARMAAGSSRLPEFPTDITEGMEHVQCLVERFGQYCGTTREGIDTADEGGDASTADLFTEISRCADLQLYFLESHLQA